MIKLDHRFTAAKEWFALISYRSATGAVATQANGTTIVIPKGQGTLITAFLRHPRESSS